MIIIMNEWMNERYIVEWIDPATLQLTVTELNIEPRINKYNYGTPTT